MTYHKSRNEADSIWLQAFTIFHSSARNRILPASRRRNIMKNKLIALLTMSALAVGTLAGCGNTAATDTAASAADTAAEPTVEAVSTAADEATDTSADSADKYADLSGSVSMSGSTSMEKLANAVAESFMEKYPNVTVTAEFTGSSAGIESVLAGSVDIGNSSRNLKDDEKSAGAVENIVAIDGIAVVADPANKVEDLTKDQLVSIYTGETKNWSEVGGDDQAIVVVGREAGSGTRGAFEELLDIADACVYANELDSTGAVMAKVASTPGAIGYVSLDVVDDSVKALKLDGVDATEENIKAGNYALSRPFVMATKGEISEQKTEVQALFDYLSSDEGKALIKSVGLITVD
jgi:phosphate transport system substrate-binding protein